MGHAQIKPPFLHAVSGVVQLGGWWPLFDEDGSELDRQGICVQLSDVPGGIQYKAENYHSITDAILASEGIPHWAVAILFVARKKGK